MTLSQLLPAAAAEVDVAAESAPRPHSRHSVTLQLKVTARLHKLLRYDPLSHLLISPLSRAACQRLHALNSERLQELEGHVQCGVRQQEDWVLEKQQLLAIIERQHADLTRLHVRVEEHSNAEAALERTVQSAATPRCSLRLTSLRRSHPAMW